MAICEEPSDTQRFHRKSAETSGTPRFQRELAETSGTPRFQRELERTRAKIEALPEAQREPFLAMAAEAYRQHLQMEESCATIRNAISDISLILENAKFQVWAMRQKARCPQEA